MRLSKKSKEQRGQRERRVSMLLFSIARAETVWPGAARGKAGEC